MKRFSRKLKKNHKLNFARLRFLIAANGARIKRQDADEEELERQLCEDKGAGEWFRLETGEAKCRDVIQCTASVSRNSLDSSALLRRQLGSLEDARTKR